MLEDKTYGIKKRPKFYSVKDSSGNIRHLEEKEMIKYCELHPESDSARKFKSKKEKKIDK